MLVFYFCRGKYPQKSELIIWMGNNKKFTLEMI